MTTCSSACLPALSPAFNTEVDEKEDFLCISFISNIEAVRDRIFHAFTNAEYMETWLMIPGVRQGTTPIVTSNSEGFQIRYEDQAIGISSIVGLYQICRRGKIHFTWKHGTTVSKGAIRLAGNFGSTNLSLMHAGFSSEAECAWHRILWEESLRKMGRILKRVAPLSNQQSNGVKACTLIS